MSNSGLGEPLLRNALPHGGGKIAMLVSLSLGVVIGVFVSRFGAVQDGQEPIDMAFWNLQTAKGQQIPQPAMPFQQLRSTGISQPLPSVMQPTSVLQPQHPMQQSMQSAIDHMSAAPGLTRNVATAASAWDAPVVGDLNSAAKIKRLEYLEQEAITALTAAVESGKKVVFPNALIAGDAVITYLLNKANLLPKVPVLAVDTLHLFPESLEFLETVEKEYNFKAHISMAEGITGYGAEAKAMYDKVYGADLWQTNIEEYDRLCKVEPFQRGLKTLGAEVIITGRTRWQGNERAWLDIYEAPRKPGGLGNCNPIASWTLEDTFDYIALRKVPHHPLHAKGYPSIGDAKDTVPIPNDGSVYFKDWKFTGDKTEWLGYALERKGRFVGLKNKDGSTKTECGIHVEGAEKTWDRDLWDKSANIKAIDTDDEIMQLKSAADGSLVVVYAPWCQFCQAMEGSFDELSKSEGLEDFQFIKFRGDTRREFVQSNLETQSFPTIGFMKNGQFQKYASEDRSVPALRRFIKDSDTGVKLNE
jgi:phosphoadenosine phosphosulfate reductase